MFINGKVFNGMRIRAFMFGNDEYEIYKTMKNDTILVVKESLHSRWDSDGFLDNVDPFERITIENKDYWYLKSAKEYRLDAVVRGGITQTTQEAFNFAFALKQAREKTNISLGDGIYVEEYGYVLPTYSNKTISDDELLGHYFSGLENKNFSDGNIKSMFLSDGDFEKISRIVDIEYKKKEIVKTKKVPSYGEKFTLVGRPELEKFFNEHIVNILNEPERYKKLGIDFPSSIILYGPPGCGKTYAVDKLVEFLKLPKFEINSSSVASPYIHDTSKKISAVFDDAINNAPSVVVIDEMESYLSSRRNAGEGTHHIEEVAEFLRQIQEANKKHVIVIAMTNMLDKIDPAILRKGRFDHHIEVGYPSQSEIESLLISLFKNISVSKDIDVSEIASKLNGRSLADVSFVVKEAALNSGKAGLDVISYQSILEAINMLPNRQEKRKIGFGE